MASKPTGKPVGRPALITKEVLQKLEDAFAMGATDDGACIYADISPQTLYNYQTKFPEFLERKRLLKERPVLKALNTVTQSLTDPTHAKWYLEKKHADFKPKSDLNVKVERIDEEEKKKLDDVIESIFE